MCVRRDRKEGSHIRDLYSDFLASSCNKSSVIKNTQPNLQKTFGCRLFLFETSCFCFSGRTHVQVKKKRVTASVVTNHRFSKRTNYDHVMRKTVIKSAGSLPSSATCLSMLVAQSFCVRGMHCTYVVRSDKTSRWKKRTARANEIEEKIRAPIFKHLIVPLAESPARA